MIRPLDRGGINVDRLGTVSNPGEFILLQFWMHITPKWHMWLFAKQVLELLYRFGKRMLKHLLTTNTSH